MTKGLQHLRKLLLISHCLLSLFLCSKSRAQALPPIPQAHHGSGHKFTVAMGHAHVAKQHGASGAANTTLGALVFHYDYLFGEKWGLGTHNDVIIEEHPVVHQDNGEEYLVKETELPFATKIVGSYKPGKHTLFMFGLGDEINNSGHHFLSTVGIDYGWELRHGWEIGGELTYDFVRHASNNWVLGLGISKTFHLDRHKPH